MGWILDLGADKYVKAMTVAIRRADKVVLETMTTSLLDLSTDSKHRYDVGGLPTAIIL